ncbi:Spo0B C-terminal domain-containing protein [Bacillus coahuilensis]|uniref:Spo0B C-terminal domain-containing protein n=1 Tax=Bacillus coahuilensis TaxID=408580 RepID=UPI000750363E|nr:Spo0B C-terminal domain-containing protein [Bacillus coahuilensis]
MNKEWTIVEALRHARHDFMNDLQLIKGNLALGKHDRVNDIIKEMIHRAQGESALSSCRIPSVAEWILTYNWTSHPIHLEFELLEGNTAHQIDEVFLLDLLVRVVSTIEEHTSYLGENHLLLSIELKEENSRLILDFQGKLEDKASLHDWFGAFLTQEKVRYELEQFTETEFVLTLLLT